MIIIRSIVIKLSSLFVLFSFGVLQESSTCIIIHKIWVCSPVCLCMIVCVIVCARLGLFVFFVFSVFTAKSCHPIYTRFKNLVSYLYVLHKSYILFISISYVLCCFLVAPKLVPEFSLIVLKLLERVWVGRAKQVLDLTSLWDDDVAIWIVEENVLWSTEASVLLHNNSCVNKVKEESEKSLIYERRAAAFVCVYVWVEEIII